jgi:kinesin family protein 3/17
MEKAMQQETELRKAEIEVQERKRQEQRMKEELEAQMEEKLNLEQQYQSKEEQVAKMTAKLEKLFHRHKQTQQEIQDLQKEFQQEREDMLENIRELRKEVKLVQITIESFVPMEHYQQIVERAQYDESTDEWVINNIELAGNRIRPNRKRAAGDDEDMNGAQALLRGNPQQDQNDHLMNERPNVYFVYTEDGGAQRAEARSMMSPTKQQKSAGRSTTGKRPTTTRPNSAARKGRASKPGNGSAAMPLSNFLHSPEPEEDDNVPHQFPKARGLVKSSG